VVFPPASGQDHDMPVFAVTYRYTDDAEKRTAVRPTHREYLRGLAEQGLLLVSGPYAASEDAGALLIYQAGTKDEVLTAVEKDPFSTEGLVAGATVTEWDPVSGPLAQYF
jgi:uncharacterized protein